VYDHGSLLMRVIDLTHAGQIFYKEYWQKGEYKIYLPIFMDDKSLGLGRWLSKSLPCL